VRLCHRVLLFLTSLVGLGELLAELADETDADLTRSPFLSVLSLEVELHFASISLRLLAAVFAWAQLGVS
jgi:hypothetical protein